ncbi:MAG: CS1-pili formation C-terminal domain-containing protein [Woeseia sp.]
MPQHLVTASGLMCTLVALATYIPAALAESGATSAFVTTSSSPPRGFEDLAGPQVTQVDVYYGGRLQLTTMARYERDEIELLSPDEVVAAIPNLTDRMMVTEALTGPLQANADKLCLRATQQDCGTLAPGIAGVIFDESRFRLDLFVAPYLLEAQTVHRSRFLPEPSADFSSLHMVSLSLSGGDRLEQDGYNISAMSLFARRADRLRARYDLADDGFSVSELSWQRDLPGWQYEVGSFRSYGRSIAFLGERHIIGLRAGGSLDTRADLETAEATPIYLFLNQRSRVDVRRAGQLLDSRFYEAGNQQLDTSQLPDGAYEIEVQTQDGSGQGRRQTFFFVRSARLPPLDQPLYFFEAGRLAQTGESTLPQVGDNNWLRAGTARRFAGNFGAETELVHNGGTTMLQGGVFLFGQGWQLEAGLLGTSRSDRAVSVRGTLRRGQTAAGIDLRRVRAAPEAVLTDPFDPVPQSYTQGALTLSTPLFDGRFIARAQLDQRGSAGTNTALGVSYSRSLFRRSGLLVDLNIDATSDPTDSVLRIGIRGYWRRDGMTASVKPHIAARFGDSSSTKLMLDARATRNSRATRFGDVGGSVFAASDVDTQTFGAGVTSESGFGYGNVDVQHTSRFGYDSLVYSANARFSIVTDDRKLAWGGRRSDLSAIVLDFSGDASTDFAVLVDRHPAGVVQTSKRNVIGLRPYRTYEIRLEPRGETIVDFDQRVRSVTLYPGNVETLRFEANEVTVVVGQIVDPSGIPLANARIDGISGYAGTDENGWFQIEIAGPQVLSIRRADQTSCAVKLPPYQSEQGLAVLDPLICQSIPE